MAEPTEDLSGKVVIVTGAGSVGGIGAATARILARAGARVVLSDLAVSELDATTRALFTEDLDVVQFPADISNERDVMALMAFTQQTFGRLDALDNNAAIQEHQQDLPVCDMSAEFWDKVFGVNARGTMLMCKHAVPLMIAGGGGSIINISSGLARTGDFFATAYAASKGAINTLTKYVAVQYGSKGIRCNAIAPGLIETPTVTRLLPEAIRAVFTGHSLTGRLGEPEDIGEMVAFLASSRSKFITGQIFAVDGGIYAHIPTIVEVAALTAGGG